MSLKSKYWRISVQGLPKTSVSKGAKVPGLSITSVSFISSPIWHDTVEQTHYFP
jgi:hypothetical protein